jgi:hypothetical protein
MTDDHMDRVVRLLDLINEVVTHDGSYPNPNLPFSVDSMGHVTFDSKMMALLNRPENADLIDWAHKHVESLFL